MSNFSIIASNATRVMANASIIASNASIAANHTPAMTNAAATHHHLSFLAVAFTGFHYFVLVLGYAFSFLPAIALSWAAFYLPLRLLGIPKHLAKKERWSAAACCLFGAPVFLMYHFVCLLSGTGNEAIGTFGSLLLLESLWFWEACFALLLFL